MWAAIHSKHHVHSDTEQDPHSPTKSFFHSHMGWMLTPFRADPERYAKAAMQDPVVMFVSRTTFWWAVLGCLIPYFVAGWEGFLWGTLVRVFVVHHVTWSVNSICHTFGSRPYATGRDLSTNNWIVGLLAMGEGWHNNHHAFPKSAFHGLHWKQFDLSGQVIRAMGTLRLAREICTIPRDVIEARKTRLARAA
jgi:stearoyl-CoA desaturase (delta-9 desaturase)